MNDLSGLSTVQNNGVQSLQTIDETDKRTTSKDFFCYVSTVTKFKFVQGGCKDSEGTALLFIIKCHQQSNLVEKFQMF